ncbi:GGDEF domain-containing protein [Gilvimarinus agarilyticus]|uniref:diguanylate cyclase domain-containing protein n=1 Tax=unclassified Gilvimarinus TaxID=2642066 RepID=UPI001C09BFDF|nr:MULTISPECIES: diguanylate cyclase [unclassified Gilvimarinus]MBU2886683.1 GGDEF domain-containing protein [Gilvimarinus agarilyticus]MDO6571351.1 diguanylate cyclase [Gilvimarinus sp. 2_MG-2023]MDO6746233.1 diguanylate cyclase [Gilvimarinus sp. 1_MG-2023]
MIKLHKWKLLFIAIATNFTILLTLALGDPKLWGDIDWFDIVGEGGVSLLAAMWLVFILNSRPAGSVTNFLCLGLGFIFIGTFQDLLDEIIALPDESFFRGALESLLMPFGLIVLTFGLYHWHKEQLVFLEQRRRREQETREYRWQDQLTDLGDARFLKLQLSQQIRQCRANHQPLALILLDLDRFNSTNRTFGHSEGDRLLRELSELLILNLRRCDLLCRYAGDRFAIVLPNTPELMANELAQQLIRAVASFAYKTNNGDTVYHNASVGVAADNPDREESITEIATVRLMAAKDQKKLGSAA